VQGIPELAAGTPECLHGHIKLWIIGRQASAIAIGYDVQHIARGDMQAVSDFLWQNQTDRVANLAKFDRGGHIMLLYGLSLT
jgi:hypothetical protein